MFRTDDVASQLGTFSLVPQLVDAVRVPLIAAGGIADGRGIAAAFMLGASAVQIGMAYLFTPEATIAEPHRCALSAGPDRATALTNTSSPAVWRGASSIASCTRSGPSPRTRPHSLWQAGRLHLTRQLVDEVLELLARGSTG